MNGDIEAGGNGQIGAVVSKNQTGTVIGRLGYWAEAGMPTKISRANTTPPVTLRLVGIVLLP